MEPISAFDKALEFTLRWEGGYVHDKDDPGGETKYGISKRAYPNLNIKDLTREEAASIYRRDYWETMGCPHLNYLDGIAIFDTAVNCGVARTTIWLDSSKDFKDLLAQRRLHYQRLVERKPLMGKFLKGWNHRVDALLAFLDEIGKHTKQ